MVLLLVAACAGPDPGSKDSAAGVAPALLEGDGVLGGEVLAWGNGGAWRVDGDALAPLWGIGSIRVTASDGRAVVDDYYALIVEDLTSGARRQQMYPECLDETEWRMDAWPVGDEVWMTCIALERTGLVYRVDTDVNVADTGLLADRLLADRGTLYAITGTARPEGTVVPVDVATARADGEPLDVGLFPDIRGDSLFYGVTEAGEGPRGSLVVQSLSAPEDVETLDLPDDDFVNGVDRVSIGLALVNVFAWPSTARPGILLDAGGAVVDTLESCPSPALRLLEGTLEGWCADPLRRYTWDLADGTRLDETTFDGDIQYVRVVEPGD